jgi:WD40 repeat protein
MSDDKHVADTMPAQASGEATPIRSRTWDPEELPIMPADKRYEILDEVARGGLGRILRAHDRRLDRPVAIKELLSSGGDATHRFLREAQLAARLEHPSIISVHDVGRWASGQPFYAMKLVEGKPLDALVRAARSLAERIALLPNVIAAIEGVACAHAAQVIHRDLKPSNVIVGAYGETVVIDWGLAKDLTTLEPERRGEGSIGSDGQLTLDGAVLGTPAYMPLEQARGEPVDERADVYALGALLYHVLAGDAPYVGTSAADVLAKVRAGEPVPLADRIRELPAELCTIVARAMAREREDRYAHAGELASELRRYQAGKLVASHAYSSGELLRRWMRRHATLLAASSIFTVTLAIVGVFAAQRVVHERNVARTREADATLQRAEARRRSDELVLLQAQSWLDRDPTVAVAWLKLYPASGENRDGVRDTAMEAHARFFADRVLAGPDGMASLSFSADGRRLAAGSYDRSVVVWDLADGRMRTFPGHENSVMAVALSADGSRLASCSYDKTVRLWDVDTGAALQLHRFPDVATWVTLAGDGTLLVATDGGVMRWDPSTDQVTPLAGGPATPATVVTPGRGGQIAASYEDHMVRVWPASGPPRVLSGHTESVLNVSFSPDGTKVASSGYDRTVRVWDLAGGTSVTYVEEANTDYACFSPDGTRLAYRVDNGAIKLRDIATGEARALPAMPGTANYVAFSPDGRHLASVYKGGWLYLWDISTRAVEVRPQPSLPHAVAFAPDGRLAIGGRGGLLQLAGTPLAMPATTVYALAFAPDGGRLAAAAADLKVRVWDLGTGMVRELAGHTDEVDSVAFSPDGRMLATGSDDTNVRLWDLATGESRILAGHQSTVSTVAWAPDSRHLASGSNDGTVRIWSVDGGAPRVLGGHRERVMGVAFAPDGTLYSADSRGTVRRWSPDLSGSVELAGREHGLLALAISPDGHTLATGGKSGAVHVWDVDRGVWGILRGHTTKLASLAFSPDGRTLASAALDRSVRVWRVADAERVPLDAPGFAAWLDAATNARIGPDDELARP